VTYRKYGVKEENGGHCMMRNGMICTVDQILLWWQVRQNWMDILCAWDMNDMCARFWWTYVKQRPPFEDTSISGRSV